MVEVAVRDPKTGLLMRDLLRYTPRAAVVEVRNLAKTGREAVVLPAAA